MRVIAHRGSPENSLPGIRQAVTQVGAVEIDVRLHPSGRVFLMHDATLDRTTPERGEFANAPLETLRRIKVPTLEEALDAGALGHMVVEMKTDSPKRAAGTARAVADTIPDGRKNVTVSSFDLPELARFKRLRPDVQTEALFDGVPLRGVDDAVTIGASSIGISAAYVDDDLLRDAASRGIDVNVWTVNTKPEFARLQDTGLVAGVYSDAPQSLLQGISSSASSSPPGRSSWKGDQ